MVEDGAFNHKIDYVTFLCASKSQYWYKTYCNFAEWVDLPISEAPAVEGLLSMVPTRSS